MFVCIRSSLHSVRFGQLLRCAQKRIVNRIKVYIERNNMQVELIRFRKKYRLYSRLLLQSEEFSDRRNVYAAQSMDLAYNKSFRSGNSSACRNRNYLFGGLWLGLGLGLVL